MTNNQTHDSGSTPPNVNDEETAKPQPRKSYLVGIQTSEAVALGASGWNSATIHSCLCCPIGPLTMIGICRGCWLEKLLGTRTVGLKTHIDVVWETTGLPDSNPGAV